MAGYMLWAVSTSAGPPILSGRGRPIAVHSPQARRSTVRFGKTGGSMSAQPTGREKYSDA